MAAQRHLNLKDKTVRVEFSNGNIFGPVDFTPVSDALTRMIVDLDNRVSQLESERDL